MQKTGSIGPSGKEFLEQVRHMAGGVSSESPPAKQSVPGPNQTSSPGSRNIKPVPTIKQLNWDWNKPNTKNPSGGN